MCVYMDAFFVILHLTFYIEATNNQTDPDIHFDEDTHTHTASGIMREPLKDEFMNQLYLEDGWKSEDF